jgi:hypothetical protein
LHLGLFEQPAGCTEFFSVLLGAARWLSQEGDHGLDIKESRHRVVSMDGDVWIG